MARVSSRSVLIAAITTLLLVVCGMLLRDDSHAVQWIVRGGASSAAASGSRAGIVEPPALMTPLAALAQRRRNGGGPWPGGTDGVPWGLHSSVGADSQSSDVTGGFGWRFSAYEPSAMETRWAAESKPLERAIHDGSVCALWRRSFRTQGDKMEADLAAFAQTLRRSVACSTDKLVNVGAASLFDFDHSIFSRMKYEFQCVRPPCASPMPPGLPALGAIRYSYIEPLVGLLRHPGTCNDTRRFEVLMDKSYLLMEPWPLAAVKPPSAGHPRRVFFFDAGASLWRDVQHWFYDVYKNLCATFSDVYAWEIKPWPPETIFALIPGHIRPRYHWYNIPLQTAVDSWDNPNNHLLSQVAPEDVVIYKIDFDAPAIEENLIQQILDYPEIIERVDELFFEHHVDMEFMEISWKLGFGKYMSDSITLFTRLRNKGIRAHSWI